MSVTTPGSFITGLLPFIRNRPMADADKAFVLNLANDHFSSLAFWRWLARSEPEIALSGAQEYSYTPSAAIIRVALVYLTTTAGRFTVLPPMGLAPDTDTSENLPSMFSYRESGGDAFIRLWPKPPTSLTGKLIPLAKVDHTRVTTGNLATASVLLHPTALDHIFSLFVLHYMYLWAQVGSQGEIVHAQGNQTTRGILAQALAAVDAVRTSDAIMFDSSGQPFNL